LFKSNLIFYYARYACLLGTKVGVTDRCKTITKKLRQTWQEWMGWGVGDVMVFDGRVTESLDLILGLCISRLSKQNCK